MILRAGLAFLFSAPAFAATVSADFTSRANYDASAPVADRAVWNQALGQLHPSLRLVNYKTGYVDADSLAIDVGDGSDGAFTPDTYARFSADLSGNVIRLDTDAHPELRVTTFVLAPGWRLRPVGSRPLVVPSQRLQRPGLRPHARGARLHRQRLRLRRQPRRPLRRRLRLLDRHDRPP